MALYITGPVVDARPRTMAIAFDQKTWTFYIVADDVHHPLSPDGSLALIQEIEKAVAEGRKRNRADPNG
jgi:hypothetical protein